MRSTFDLPDELMKRAKIAAIERGYTLRELVTEALHKLLSDPSNATRERMTQAPITLPRGKKIPVRTNSELAQIYEQDEVSHLNDVYRGR